VSVTHKNKTSQNKQQTKHTKNEILIQIQTNKGCNEKQINSNNNKTRKGIEKSLKFNT
jgi:hypothetical protein